MKLCILHLTCSDEKEADIISKVLLEKKLVICVKKFPVSSAFLWEGKLDKAKEVFLMMDSFEENYDKVEQEVAKIHSYKTFVLLSVPVIKTTKKVQEWMRRELK